MCARMIEKSRLRTLRDQGDDDSSIPAAGNHETGHRQRAFVRRGRTIRLSKRQRAGAKVMYQNLHVLRLMMVTDSAGSFVEWIER